MRVLFGQSERSFYASELIRDAGTGSGAAQRELARLEGSGLIVARRIGHQKHYQANAASPLFSELRNIVLKTVGLAEPLRDALKPLSSAIRAAFVYGSVAAHMATWVKQAAAARVLALAGTGRDRSQRRAAEKGHLDVVREGVDP